MDVREELSKIEIVVTKEIEVYKLLLEYEEKKIIKIINGQIQDIDILCSFQVKQITRANELRELREKYIDAIAQKMFLHLVGNSTLLDIIKRVPYENSGKLSEMRFELITIMAKVRHLNKLAPKLLDESLDMFRNMRDVLNESKKIGYNNKGKEQAVNRRLGALINKQV